MRTAIVKPVDIDFDCTYKKGQLRQVFGAFFPGPHGSPSLRHLDTQRLYNTLLPLGFMPGNMMATGTACIGCNSCISLRIRANDYPFSASERYVLNHNRDLQLTIRPVNIRSEHFDLYQNYTRQRHPDDFNKDLMPSHLQNMLEAHSHMMEVRSPKGKLLCVMIFDAMDDAFSGYTAFYDIAESKKRSLGKFAVLTLLQSLKKDFPIHIYIGAWVKDSPRIDYKKNFHNLEMFNGREWLPFDPSRHKTAPHPSRIIPIIPG